MKGASLVLNFDFNLSAKSSNLSYQTEFWSLFLKMGVILDTLEWN